MATGVLIAESIPPPASLDAVTLTVHRLERVTPDNISPDFEVADDDAARLAEALAGVLGDFGWYADLHTADESFVVYAGRVFRYPRGDADGRAEAQAHGRAHGVPEPQLDWP